jgi:RNA polymerase sigma-70 factor, ECF subfamily
LTDRHAELAAQLAAGCTPTLLEDLYDAHGQWCYRLAHGVLGEPHLAYDVVQEVFLAVWAGNAVFDPTRGSVRSWLARVTHNKAVDAVRRSERHSSRAAAGVFTWMPATDDVESDVWAHERRRHVLAALNELSAVQRQALELAYFGGHTQVEIAALTDTALGTIKTRTLAGLRQLRTNIELLAVQDAEGWAGAIEVSAAP